MSSRGTTAIPMCSASLKGSNGGPAHPACMASSAIEEALEIIRSMGSPSSDSATTDRCVQNLEDVGKNFFAVDGITYSNCALKLSRPRVRKANEQTSHFLDSMKSGRANQEPLNSGP